MTDSQENIIKRSKKIKIIFAIILIMVNIVIFNMLYHRIACIYLRQADIHGIFISVSLSSPQKSIYVSTTIEDSQQLEDTIKIINSLRVLPGMNLEEKLGGDTPTAYIGIYDEQKREIDSIYIYYDILRWNGNYYSICPSEHDKLGEICSKYGERQSD